MKNWKKKSIALVASAALMVPATSAFAEAPQKTAKNQDLVKVASNKDQTFKNQKEWISKDTIIVKHSGLDKNVHNKIGAKVIRSIPSLGYDVIQLNKGTDLEKAVSYYATQKGVKNVSPSYVYHSFGTAADPKKKDMYHLNLLQIDKALQLAGNHEVKVAVIDGGVDFKHPDLKSQVLPPYNAAAPANTSSPDEHGTHVAGIIGAAKDNGIGGHGINPKAKLLPIDVFNGNAGASDFAIAQGILYATEQGADVINMSLGGFGTSPLIEDAVQKAIDKGITIVAAAGNESTDTYAFPASYEGVISVGSTNDRNKLSDYSNYGPSVDLVAPGEDIYSTVRDEKKGSSFAKISGTSMASPVVAGVASLLKSKYPNLKPYEIEAILEMTAKDLGETGYDLTFGNGLVDPIKALQFDINNLPKQYSETKEDQIKNAKVLKKDIVNTEKGSFNQPDEKKWYKVDLDANEYAQLTLKGEDKYDYAFDLYYYPEGSNRKVEPIKVNDVRVGKEEGYLYKADQKGTLLIGVKDYNGSYSLNGQSKYTFTAQTTKELPIDSLDMEHMENIEKFPFSTEGKNYTLLSEDHLGDKDYFTFSVNEPTTLKFDLSGTPGVTASMELYLKEDLPTETIEGLDEAYPIRASYGTDKGEGVNLVVDAMPNEKYVISVSNENSTNASLEMFFSGGIDTEATVSESIIPYTLKGEVVTLPEDEDGLTLEGMLENNVQEDLLPFNEYKTKKRNQMNDFMNIFMNPDAMGQPENVDQIMEQATRFNIGQDQKAYFQTEDDEDYFTFTAKENAVYGFNIQKGINQLPAGNIFEYDAETNELIPVSSLTNDMGLLSILLGSSIDENEAKTIALKKDKTYVVKVMNLGDRSSEPYTLKTSKMANVPQEDNRNHTTAKTAIKIQPGTTYKDHLIYQDDTDFYYYKQYDKDEVMSLLISSVPYTKEQLDQLPKELQNDLKFSGSIIEDTNGNRKIDPKEMATEIQFGQGEDLLQILMGLGGTTDVNTSFKAKQGHGYFIVLNGSNVGQVSIQPYTLTLFDHKNADEDANSKLVNGIPTKPTVLTKKDGKWVANQYLNAGVAFGDKDYFEFKNDSKRDVFFSLKTEKALDGVIRIIDAKGKTVETLDFYGAGDAEVGTVTLDKGTYFIEVSEYYGKASSQPYTLEIK
ncbi:S8 family peptidase [Lysinibacillus xylanilyticus]|uniref:S8 family peptidase n=1 Tax=Lysinibacillus xylanilyticus TaxID=582475 RepID=UPI002B247606|nr:S8 family peptidase [Lysinibacillus xylanilyticus]MEB2299583.1 S8 family peptidase [Lysinibacillus xylanilyticus]